MVEFLDTNATSSELSKLIISSKEKLFLVSPYLQLSDRIKILIEQAEIASPDMNIRVLYRSDKDGKINDSDRDFLLKQLGNADIYGLDNLHAKCYLNEQTTIITSMNLYQHSQENNWEMGVKINRSTDPAQYNDVYSHVDLLFKAGKKHEKKLIDFGKLAGHASNIGTKLHQVSKMVTEKSCYCIRCGKDTDYDMDRPLCNSCFKSWSRYGDTKYAEKFCHYCGKASKTSVGRPICYDCYKKLNK